MPADLPESVSISGAEIKLTVCAVSNGVLCSNLAESKSVLKMCAKGRRCIFKGWEKVGVKEIVNSDKPLPPIDPFEEIYQA